MALRLKKGDLVQVISGKDKGSRGVILRVLPQDGKAVVEGINLIKRHQRPRSQQDPGGIITKEAPIQLCNLMIVDPQTDKPTRFGTKITKAEDGSTKKVRFSKASGVELP